MYKNLISLIRISVGLVLLLLGVIGVLLPIIHGWVLIVLAIPLISPEHGKKMVAYAKEWKQKSLGWIKGNNNHQPKN